MHNGSSLDLLEDINYICKHVDQDICEKSISGVYFVEEEEKNILKIVLKIVKICLKCGTCLIYFPKYPKKCPQVSHTGVLFTKKC